ncbi:hypothetical protein GIY30_11535 [Gordonia sp. HNM0687]|uniref:Uncharacterized protein n=1 Tax=Gordonia mangrovi TaxID=2665643 RepID=A0A6L7GQ02_9ACTN|nr:hypothetical protein [Gordonia mangrovi]MXP21980.1 hypothetical protein [Gordonia mangrovi]UVF76337.1 hypothetical protein NWF22_13155 [Gordonia mangrovi]
MSTIRRLRRPLGVGLRPAMVLGGVLAILLMHSVVAGSFEPHPAPAHTSMAAIHGAPQSLDEPVMHDAVDCDTHQHPCVFLRSDDPVVIALAVLVLAWGFPIPPLLRSIPARLRGRSGRPPPWAMPTHLRLQVIRC